MAGWAGWSSHESPSFRDSGRGRVQSSCGAADEDCIARSLPQRLTREEAAALLAQPNPRYPTGVRDRALLRLYYRAGLRCSEALALRPRDVNLTKCEVTVWKGKGDKDRVVWFDSTTAEILDRWRAIRPSSPWFFSTLAGGQLHDSHIRHMVARRGAKAGIAIRAHPHQLRHSFACEMLEDGFSVYELQKMMGHADLETTARYLHLVDEQLASRLRDRA